MKKIIFLTFVVMLLIWIFYAFLVGTVVSEIGKAGGVGSIIGKEVHNFNKAAEGK